MIFVFGSNKLGIHGAGSALFAFRNYRAKWGVGEGITKRAYALPTKHTPQKAMTIREIQESVFTFLSYAKHSRYDFKITQVGCGLGGWTKEDIAPLFSAQFDNCFFDTAWRDLLPPGTKFWGTF